MAFMGTVSMLDGGNSIVDVEVSSKNAFLNLVQKGFPWMKKMGIVGESETFESLAQKDRDGCRNNKYGKQLNAISAVSNGSVTLKLTFSVATDQRSYDLRQITEGISNIASTRDTKLEAMPGAAKQSLQSKKSYVVPPPMSKKELPGQKEQIKHLKLLEQRSPAKVEETADSASLRPKEGDAKPQRTGHRPSYGFSFKCDERAEKRKEFYLKLGEKTRAKEVERTNRQAKSKETQEAEIKILRKSLNFKATPMPSFYHEPTPPKVELKKMPPTKAKSPKLGCQKNSATAVSEDDSSPQNDPNKRSSPQQNKKPLPKSPPKIPLQKTTLARGTKNTTSVAVNRVEEEEEEEEEDEATQTCEPAEIQAQEDTESGEQKEQEQPS